MKQCHRFVPVSALLTIILTLAACSVGARQTPGAPSAVHSDAHAATSSGASAAPPQPDLSSRSDDVVGTTVHFTAGSTAVAVTVAEDNATTRDFLSMLPMTLEFEDYHGQEKISYPPRPFDYVGTPGITPQVGDLFSYKPWANLGFFYNVDGLGHSDDLVRIGTSTDLDKIMDLDGKQVTIQIADRPF